MSKPKILGGEGRRAH